MTMHAAFKALDIASYASLAQRLCAGSCGLAFSDRSGDEVLASADGVRELMRELTDGRPDWSRIDDGMKRIDLGSGRTALVITLHVEGRKDSGYMIWWLDTSRAPESAGDMFDAVLALAACVRNELLLQNELDAMARELSERYEELNLVYHTDDQVSAFREGYQAFRVLVQNCADYLDSGLAMLYLRDKKILVVSDAKADDLNARRIQVAIEERLYDEALRSPEIRFLNNGEVAAPVAGAPPYRVMVCPIRASGDAVDGVLVIANLLSRRPFSNSDKNLLHVMSRKAAKIIQGSYDALTGTLNRASFEHLLRMEAKEIRGRAISHGLFHLNIDKLHVINDTLGHEAGDMVISAFTRAIAAQLRDTDSIARIGGDEIAILVRNCGEATSLTVADKLLGSLRGLHLEWQGRSIQVTASIGIVLVGATEVDGDQLMTNAVVACGAAKDAGGDRSQIYSSDDGALRQREESMWMVGTVQAALREDRFLLYAQPIVPRSAGGTPHLEVLLRMKDGERILGPGAFLPASERYQLMIAIDRWVVENALRQIGPVLAAHSAGPPVIGINLSGQSFSSPDFLGFCRDAVSRSGIPPEQLCFEITESSAIANIELAQTFINSMRQLGCSFALDDFGAGLSSFGYLKSFDVQYLKIDGSLVRDIVASPVTAAMVEAVNQIGHVMGLQTIAEFVETAQQHEVLRRIGVDYFQGYLLGKPGPLLEQLAMLGRRDSAVLA